MKNKVLTYMGFAKRSGNLVSGVNTCSFNISKGKAKLIILAEDISENSEKKIMKDVRKHSVDHIKYGSSDELSHATGTVGRTVFAVLDSHFAETIKSEIERDLKIMH
ncbi:MAG: ribosomal L7Ae/L30e/S12e/Gadd45 family protein [Bacillota bacterium]|nr:ribosomal L7Ae/L30e/S12e/Gadd45 family protein [Bacillota bacterium]